MTSTVPIEVVYAAGLIPVDLNNAFIEAEDKLGLVEQAEAQGLPRNLCSWIKGIYAVSTHLNIERIIGVVEGDCSNTQALLDLWKEKGFNVITFSYPADRDLDVLKFQMERLMQHLSTDWKKVEETKLELDEVRKKVWELDELTWQANQVKGFENHFYQVGASDFRGNPKKFGQALSKLIEEVKQRKPFKHPVRLAYVGVPPIFPEIYSYLESIGARVVLNEVQRQFSMPFKWSDLVERYLQYTFPYDVFHRLKDIKHEIQKRQIDGVIHYTQSFCHRAIHDIIIRKEVEVPVVTIEGDKPGDLDVRTKLRLQTFVEMLKESKS